MAVEETKTNILDAAESFFAEMGFHATSLRQITERAGVNVASVNYHFGSKENLMDAVLRRRLEPLNVIRLARLEAVKAEAAEAGKTPSVRAVMVALIDPTLRAVVQPEFGGFSMIMSRIFTEHKGAIMERVRPLIEPLLDRYLDVLYEALPNLPREEVALRLRMSLGAMQHAIHAVRGYQTDSGPMALTTALPEEVVVDSLIDFVTRGMEDS
ncbi:TetR/AcrR family transcriptional regulator [Desulfoluna spongiiphila]|uniref:TetR/AcrR family transcriptional regulator n=1 Tax=Desulfoluna spongiiphila TaxID=419481 RepID=UPI0012578D5D|nr:TetR/AcrR family transcriptional regulator [Desulfoluna spongiiphila]VVS93909.1 dna-binding hth domain tetr-type [Desulfoluna spongiiphila]